MKFIKILLILLFIGAIAVWMSVEYFIPSAAVEAINTGELPSYVPKKFEPVLKEVRKSVETNVEELPQILAQHNLTFDEILKIAETTDVGEVRPLVSELNQTEVKNADEAFDIIVDHLGYKVENPEAFRETFREKFTIDRFEKGKQFLNENEMPLDLSIEIAKKIGIQLLKERRAEIETKLREIQG